MRTPLAALALSIVAASSLTAQGPSQAASPATAKKALPIVDYARWRTITAPSITPNGAWVAWVYTGVRREDQLHVKQVDGDKDYVVDRGSRPQLSDDGKWVAYAIAPPKPAAGRGGRGGAPAATPTPATTPAPTPAPVPGAPPVVQPFRAELMNLATGEKIGWDHIASFEFDKGSSMLVVKRARAEPKPAFDGTDMIVRDLRAGTDRLIGSVGEFAFNKSGTHLAYTIDAADQLGNGLYLADINNGTDRVLENARERYSRLTWSDSGTAIAAMHGSDADTLALRPNTLVAFTALNSAKPKKVEVSSNAAGLPAKLVISEKGTLTWSAKADRLAFGLKSQDPKPKRKTDDESYVAPSDVDIFHGADDRLQTVQRAQANADRNRTDRASLDLATGKVTYFADSTLRSVQMSRDGRWAIATDDRKYVSDWEEPRADYYRIDVAAGTRTPMMSGAAGRALGMSPDSRYFIYWKDKHVWAYDLASGAQVNLTAKVPVSFVNVEDDHMAEKPAYGLSGFSKDGKFVVLDHRYDVYAVPLDGSGAAKALTQGVGTKEAIRFRYERLDADAAPAGPQGGRGGGAATAPIVIDLAKPILFSAYGDLTKKAGFYELRDGKFNRLVYEDKAFGRVDKADSTNRVLYTREDWSEFPDLLVSDLSFKSPKKLSEANPQQADYKWGRRILFYYADRDGHPLQGTLAIPDDYQPGQKLPMLVNFYEKNSQNLNRYQVPRYPGSTPSFSAFVSNGYLVMQPDVYFHGRTSHQDMLESVESAVKKVIELGYADPKHIGLQGHSYSGGGSAYISTHSKLFAAIEAGAAPIDLATEFNTLFRGSGQNNASYDIRGQGRYGTDPWSDPELYKSQSPITGVQNMNTPLLQMQGDNDQTVEWLQGVQFYNALRFLKKPVIFLSYPGEDHGLRKLENQVDFAYRLQDFFDHYLKDAPAASWMTTGERFIDKDKRKPITLNVEKPHTLPIP
ncbi:MAG: prolyl oligopeptidase family serine peptidase [Gemmatimonadaceae bacterium]